MCVYFWHDLGMAKITRHVPPKPPNIYKTGPENLTNSSENDPNRKKHSSTVIKMSSLSYSSCCSSSSSSSSSSCSSAAAAEKMTTLPELRVSRNDWRDRGGRAVIAKRLTIRPPRRVTGRVEFPARSWSRIDPPYTPPASSAHSAGLTNTSFF